MILGEIPDGTSIKHGDDILDDKENSVGMVIDFYVDQDKIRLLFVNSIENKNPHLKTGQAITLC